MLVCLKNSEEVMLLEDVIRESANMGQRSSMDCGECVGQCKHLCCNPGWDGFGKRHGML